MFVAQISIEEVLDSYPHTQDTLREQVRRDLESENYVLLDLMTRAIILECHGFWLERNVGHTSPFEWLSCMLEVEGDRLTLYAYSQWVNDLSQAYKRYTAYM